MAAQYSDRLFGHCNWSVATFAYMKAAFLYMKMIDENIADMKTEITELFR